MKKSDWVHGMPLWERLSVDALANSKTNMSHFPVQRKRMHTFRAFSLKWLETKLWRSFKLLIAAHFALFRGTEVRSDLRIGSLT